MSTIPPLALIVAGGPGAPGAQALLGEHAIRGAHLLFTGAGLEWLLRPDALERLRSVGADLALCSQSARDHGLGAELTPPGVRWSSRATWLAQRADRRVARLSP